MTNLKSEISNPNGSEHGTRRPFVIRHLHLAILHFPLLLALMRNIELKAFLHDLPAARRVAETLATQRLGIQEQIDTYFRCANGRLKLRQISGQTAQLVWYVRPSDPRPKASDYHLVPAPHPETLIAALRAAMG